MDLSSVVGLFVGAHVLLAERTGIPELAMDMSEGEQLATAVQNVMRHYPIEATQKAVDWGAMFGSIGMIYGMRFGSFMLRRAHEKQQPQFYPPNMPQQPEAGARPNGSGRAPQPQPAPRFDNDALIMDLEPDGE